jgi:hypothetical protein
MNLTLKRIGLAALPWFSSALVCLGWDYEAHRVINQLALASLPADFPAFVRPSEAQERVAFLGGEPDRWRNTPDLLLRHFNGPDHYFDVEDLEPLHLTVDSLSHFRYEFMAQLALARVTYATNLPPLDNARNTDKTRELAGFLPWTMAEYYSKLKSQFSCLKEFEENGTPEEIANARQDTLYIMGVMGHFVGDATQPLHTTKHYNGWVGNNPKDYTTSRNFHALIDGGYLNKTGLSLDELRKQLQTAQPLRTGSANSKNDDLFADLTKFMLEQNKLVEPLYQMEKEGKFTGEGETGLQGRAMLSSQLVKAGQMLGNLWLTAWQQVPPDKFLKDQLLKRKKGNGREKAGGTQP